MLPLVTNTPLVCHTAASLYNSASFTRTVLPVVKAACSLFSIRTQHNSARIPNAMQLQRTTNQLAGQARPSHHHSVVPVAALSALKGPGCRSSTGLSQAASAAWGSSLVGPSFAASPLQHRYSSVNQSRLVDHDGLSKDARSD